MSDAAETDFRRIRRGLQAWLELPLFGRLPEDLQPFLEDLELLVFVADRDLRLRIASEREEFEQALREVQQARAEPYRMEAERLRAWSDLAFQRYARSFAGRPRRTRDVALLDEICSDLRILYATAAELHVRAPEHQTYDLGRAIDAELALYVREAEAIRLARREGTATDRGELLAELMGEQLAVYEHRFAAVPWGGQHAPQLARLVQAVAELIGELRALGPWPDHALVARAEETLEVWQAELDVLETHRRAVPVHQRIEALAGAANGAMARVRRWFPRGARTGGDLDLLADLGERLVPIAKEMDALDRETHGEPANTRNLAIVLGHLRRLADRHKNILAARR